MYVVNCFSVEEFLIGIIICEFLLLLRYVLDFFGYLRIKKVLLNKVCWDIMFVK